MKLLLALFVFLGISARSQDSLSKWILVRTYALDSDAIWNADILENVYVVHNRMITKYDSSGTKKFSQSIKSIGEVKEIMPINTMKLMLFSEEQQVLCLMDNTLTMSEELIDLSEYGITSATLATTSSQPEKIWVLEQLNSRLLLLDLSGKMQFQEVKNLKGIINLSEINGMIELNNHLFLIGRGVFYEFDRYGTLLNMIELSHFNESNVVCVPSEERIFCVRKNELSVLDISDGKKMSSIMLPMDEILEFKKIGNLYYFRTADKILKYVFKNVR